MSDERQPDRPTTGAERAEPRLGVTGTQVLTSALASVSAAFVASVFGVAGTVLGAAVVSIVATVGTAVYGRGIRRAAIRLQQVTEAAAGRPVELEATPPERGWLRRLAGRRWGLVAGVAAVLVLSLGVVSLVELIGGQPLSGDSDRGRTSIGAVISGGDGAGDDGGDDDPGDDDPGDDGEPGDDDPGDDGDPDDRPGPGETEPTTTAPGGGRGGPGTSTTAPDGDTTTSTTAGATTSVPPTAPEPREEPPPEVTPGG